MTMAEIQAEVNNMEKESKALKTELYKLAWFMRGGISLEELYMIDSNDREILSELIKENLETTKNSGLPFF
jgi:hypothetical protein